MKSKSPSGLALVFIVAGIILVLSPESRRFVRRLIEKGGIGWEEALEEIKAITQTQSGESRQRSAVESENAAEQGKVIALSSLTGVKTESDQLDTR